MNDPCGAVLFYTLIFLACLLIVKITRGMAHRWQRMMRDVLAMDPLGASEESREERRRALRDEYARKKELLRWRIRRFLADLATYGVGEEKKQAATGESLIASEYPVNFEAGVEKSIAWSLFPPFVKRVTTGTYLRIIQIGDEYAPVIVIPGPPTDLVEEVRDIEEARAALRLQF